MTWTVTTGKSVLLSDGQEQTECNFTDDAGGKPFQDHLSHVAGSLQSLTDVCRRRVAKEEATTKPPPLTPVNTVIDLAPVIVVPPKKTQDEIDYDAYAARVAQARWDERFAALPADVRADFKVGYEGLI